jgi:hypothetical protein
MTDIIASATPNTCTSDRHGRVHRSVDPTDAGYPLLKLANSKRMPQFVVTAIPAATVTCKSKSLRTVKLACGYAEK